MKPDGLGWLFAPAPSRTARCRPITSRSSRRSATCCIPEQASNPTVRDLEGPLNRLAHTPTAELPGGRLHVPADRALPERPDEPVQQLAERAAAGDVRRAQPGAGRRAGHRARRLADRAVAARTDRGPRDGDAADPAAARRGPRRSTRSACRSTGASPARRVGGNANDLTSLVADANVSMHEAKAFTCQVEPGRLSRRIPDPTVPPRPGQRATRSPTRRRPPSPKGNSDRIGQRSSLTRRTIDEADLLDGICNRPLAKAAAAFDPPERRRPAGWSSSIAVRRPVPPRLDPPAARGRPPVSTPTPPSASAARPARWPASSGTSSPPTASLDRQQLRQHRDALGDLVAARQIHRTVSRRPSSRSRSSRSSTAAASAAGAAPAAG